jgi:hypothetical protein
MRKILLLSALFLCANLIIPSAKAQLVKLPKVLAFGNVTYANPTGEFKNISNYGYGYEIGAGLGLGKTLLMASVGNIRYNDANSDGTISITPWKFGVRRYLLLGLFLNGNVGFAKHKYDYDNLYNYGEPKSYFLYELGAGYKLGFVELGAAYTGFGNDMNALLFKAGLAIKL